MSNKPHSAVKSNRVLYFDVMRVLAICAVIWVHVAAFNFHNVPLNSFAWQVFNVFDAIGRWTVPVLVMISGALFLDPVKNIDIKKLFSRNIFRIVTAFFFWSGIYAVYEFACGLSLRDAIQAFLTGHYHMWYLFLIVSLYILAPALKKVTENEMLTRYVLIITAVISFVIPQSFVILSTLNIPVLPTILYYLQQTYNKLLGYLPTGYIFYYLIGDYIARHEISPKVQKGIYIAGVTACLLTMVLSSWYSNLLGYADDSFYAEISVNIAVMSVAAFVFGKYYISRISLEGNMLKVLLHMSKCSFGMYLVHDLFIVILNNQFGLNTLSFNPVIGVILLFAIHIPP